MEKITLFDSIEKAFEVIPAGENRTVRIGELTVLIFNHQNKLIAMEKECPHLGHPLKEGLINGFGEMVCPLHTYRFDIQTGEEANRRCRDLTLYPIHEENGKVVLFINQS